MRYGRWTSNDGARVGSLTKVITRGGRRESLCRRRDEKERRDGLIDFAFRSHRPRSHFDRKITLFAFKICVKTPRRNGFAKLVSRRTPAPRELTPATARSVLGGSRDASPTPSPRSFKPTTRRAPPASHEPTARHHPPPPMAHPPPTPGRRPPPPARWSPSPRCSSSGSTRAPCTTPSEAPRNSSTACSCATTTNSAASSSPTPTLASSEPTRESYIKPDTATSTCDAPRGSSARNQGASCVGKVNKVGADFVGLLVMGVFNASVASADISDEFIHNPIDAVTGRMLGERGR